MKRNILSIIQLDSQKFYSVKKPINYRQIQVIPALNKLFELRLNAGFAQAGEK